MEKLGIHIFHLGVDTHILRHFLMVFAADLLSPPVSNQLTV